MSRRPVDRLHPPAEVEIDVALVRTLLHSQMPTFADAPLTLVDEGWDNVTFRLGEEHAVRLPRREAAVPLLRNETRWLPRLAPELHVRLPLPSFVGHPEGSYPWPWSVVEWVPGVTVDLMPLHIGEAHVIADFLRALHKRAPADAPVSSVRGMPLADRQTIIEERIDRAGCGRLQPVWEAGLDAPPADTPRWLHGDLHARNVLAVEGHVSGVIDWGDMTAGDVATDLACAWLLFGSREARASLLDRYEASPFERARAGSWAVNFAASLILSGEPRHTVMGKTAARRLEADLA